MKWPRGLRRNELGYEKRANYPARIQLFMVFGSLFVIAGVLSMFGNELLWGGVVLLAGLAQWGNAWGSYRSMKRRRADRGY